MVSVLLVEGPGAVGAVLEPNEKVVGFDAAAGAALGAVFDPNAKDDFGGSAVFSEVAAGAGVELGWPNENDEVEVDAGAPKGFALVGDLRGSFDTDSAAVGLLEPNENGAGAADPAVEACVDD